MRTRRTCPICPCPRVSFAAAPPHRYARVFETVATWLATPAATTQAPGRRTGRAVSDPRLPSTVVASFETCSCPVRPSQPLLATRLRDVLQRCAARSCRSPVGMTEPLGLVCLGYSDWMGRPGRSSALRRFTILPQVNHGDSPTTSNLPTLTSWLAKLRCIGRLLLTALLCRCLPACLPMLFGVGEAPFFCGRLETPASWSEPSEDNGDDASQIPFVSRLSAQSLLAAWRLYRRVYSVPCLPRSSHLASTIMQLDHRHRCDM